MARRRPFRYTLILTSVALGAALAAAGGWRYARASAPLSGPIIIISIDTLRADHLPAYGYQKVKTPAIDLLAADGVTFDRAYSHAPVTLPAHVALLSGRLPFENGVRDDVGFGVKPGERLLPQMLRDRGYTTAAVVSASLLRKETGFNQGFDFFDDAMPANPEELTAASPQRDGLESEQIAEHWLQSVGTSRAFLFLHLYEPHKPYQPPDRFAQYSPYDGEIAYADEIVGRLIRYLKTHQLYDRSTIVLLSDHGEGLGDHGEQEHGLFVYDEAIHVPLIVKQESNVAAGRRVSDLVQHIDVVPTILDLVKAPVPGNLRGRSLKPLLEGSGRVREQSVYSEALYARYRLGWSELTAITGERYQYIRAPREELYDLTLDPRERTNLADERVDALKALDQDLARVVGRAAGQPASAASATLTDPKDRPEVVETYRRALELMGDRQWSETIELLELVVREAPDAAIAWDQLASVAGLLNRYDIALDAYRHLTDLKPSDPSGDLGAAEMLLRERKFEEARVHAAAAADLTAPKDTHARATAHELLARIALARHDPSGARDAAALAQQADPARPIVAYVDARILYDQGKYEEGLPLFEQAIAESKKAGAAPLPELHFYAGDTMARLNRRTDAETQFAEEIRYFPQNVRARASLATLYHTNGQADAAADAITSMLQAAPTPESYALAARLWRSFGKIRQAEATRAEARRVFGDGRRRIATSN